jgi:hypothetical protein
MRLFRKYQYALSGSVACSARTSFTIFEQILGQAMLLRSFLFLAAFLVAQIVVSGISLNQNGNETRE